MNTELPIKAFLLTAGVVGLSACQTNAVKEPELVFSSGIFRSEDMSAKESRVETYAKSEWITASRSGRISGVSFVNAGKRGGVFLRRKTLSIIDLKRWGRIKGKEIQRGQEGIVNTPMGSIPYERFTIQNRECFHFRYIYHLSMRDQNGRYERSLGGYFCEKEHSGLEDKIISDFIHQIGVSDDYNPRSNATNIKPQGAAGHVKNYDGSTKTEVNYGEPPIEKASSSASYRLYGTWEGVSENVKGTFFSDQTMVKGKLQVRLNLEDQPCVGQWMWGKGEYNTPNPPQGTWSIACGNGKAASGTYKSFKIGEGIIEGLDSSGRKISMFFHYCPVKV